MAKKANPFIKAKGIEAGMKTGAVKNIAKAEASKAVAKEEVREKMKKRGR